MKFSRTALARAALFLCAIVWGSAYIILKESYAELTPAFALAARFTAASALMLVIASGRLKRLDRGLLKRGITVGLFVFLGFVFCCESLVYTSASKSSFLCATSCIFTPFFVWLISRKRPEACHIIGALLCITGIGIISLNADLTVGLGDLLALLCGISYGVEIALLGEKCGEDDPVLQCTVQLCTTAILAWIYHFIRDGELMPLHVSAGAWLSVLYLAVFSTVVAFLCQNWGQKILNASSSSLIMALESVFGVLLAVLIGGEILTLRLLVGFAVVFASVVISETGLTFLRSKRRDG